MNKELSANTTLSYYRIVSKIGEGGMGEVYLAEDIKLDRKVAIKFLNEEFGKDTDKLNRFIQEAKAASALNHPNILTVYEIGEVDNKNYIATELIDGKTLREHLSQKEPLSLNTILKIGIQVAEALSAAHHAGIIHRDIKPENIMLRNDGYAKVLDFGLAKLSEPGAIATGSTGNEDATRASVKGRSVYGNVARRSAFCGYRETIESAGMKANYTWSRSQYHNAVACGSAQTSKPVPSSATRYRVVVLTS